jgi:hypothetical protein
MFSRILSFRKQVPQMVIYCHSVDMYRRITICTSKITTDQQLRSDGGLYGTPKISKILCVLVSLFNFRDRRTSTNLFRFTFHQRSFVDLLSLRTPHHVRIQSTLIKTVPLREHKCLSFRRVLPQEFEQTFLLASNLIDLLKMSFPVYNYQHKSKSVWNILPLTKYNSAAPRSAHGTIRKSVKTLENAIASTQKGCYLFSARATRGTAEMLRATRTVSILRKSDQMRCSPWIHRHDLAGRPLLLISITDPVIVCKGTYIRISRIPWPLVYQ